VLARLDDDSAALAALIAGLEDLPADVITTPPKPVRKPCLHCGRECPTQPADRKYCTGSCGNAHRVARWRERHPDR
jgi:hypothetical protein